MPTTALILYLLALAVTFGVRSWLHVRRTGDSGFRRPDEPVGSPGWWGAVLFIAALVLGLLGPVLAIADVLAPLAVLDGQVAGWLGLVLALLSFLGVLAAQTGMGLS